MFVPLFKLLMVTGIVVFGINAMFAALFRYGPLIPGPLRKNPKASLNEPLANSGYSSEPKTKLNAKLSPVGIKSNSRTAASFSANPLNSARSGSEKPKPEEGVLFVEPEVFGPIAPLTFPEPITRPEAIFKLQVEQLKDPICSLTPLKVIFVAVTPPPKRTF